METSRFHKPWSVQRNTLAQWLNGIGAPAPACILAKKNLVVFISAITDYEVRDILLLVDLSSPGYPH